MKKEIQKSKRGDFDTIVKHPDYTFRGKYVREALTDRQYTRLVERYLKAMDGGKCLGLIPFGISVKKLEKHTKTFKEYRSGRIDIFEFKKRIGAASAKDVHDFVGRLTVYEAEKNNKNSTPVYRKKTQ